MFVCKIQSCTFKLSNFLYPRYFASVTSGKKLSLPNDRKSPNSFNLFVKEKTENLKNIELCEEVKKCAEKWKTITDDEKRIYVEKSKMMKEEKKSEFQNSSWLNQTRWVEEYKEKREKREKKRKHLILKKFRQNANCPRRPPNYWYLYAKDYADKENKTVFAISKNISEKFKNLSDEEKEQYRKKYVEQLQLYKEELKEWKDEYGKEYEELKTSLKMAKEKKSTGLFKRLKKSKKNEEN
jgi:hypothetical protein